MQLSHPHTHSAPLQTAFEYKTRIQGEAEQDFLKIEGDINDIFATITSLHIFNN